VRSRVKWDQTHERKPSPGSRQAKRRFRGGGTCNLDFLIPHPGSGEQTQHPPSYSTGLTFTCWLTRWSAGHAYLHIIGSSPLFLVLSGVTWTVWGENLELGIEVQVSLPCSQSVPRFVLICGVELGTVHVLNALG
jgi:hypothetical protein